MKIIVIILIVLCFNSGFSQQDNDTIIDLNNLPEYNPDDFEPDFTIDTKKGWFLTPVKSSYTYGIGTGTSLTMYENENGISSESFELPLSFTGEKLMTNKQRMIDKKFKDAQYNNYPIKNFEKYSLISKFAIKNFTWIRFDIAYVLYRGLLMHRMEDKYFYPVGESELKKIKEIAVISNVEHGINFALGLQLPVWGGIINQGGNITESFYYLYAGFNNTQILSSKSKQFFQLANYNNEIRYRNGKDTIGIGRYTLPNLNYSRNYIEIGLGASLDTYAADMSAGLSFQFIYSYPLTSVINDDNWMQHSIRLELLVYAKGLIREMLNR